MPINDATTQESPVGAQTIDSQTLAAADADLRNGTTVVRIRGKDFTFPAARVRNAIVVVFGSVIRVATIKDEMFLEGDLVQDPEQFVAALKKTRLKADVFAFSQKPPDLEPRYDYRTEWDNVAAIPTTDFQAWWEGLPQETRKNIRRAQNRGVVVKTVSLTDDFVRGVQEIYNETPLRQGKPFYHYGKDFDTIKREIATFAETSDFLGAYKDAELIGFIKLVHMGALSSIMHIVSKNAHFDKRPTNALLAEAVGLCNRKGISYLVYGNYTYGRKGHDSLAEFKRRNGFDKIEFPRYYVPLTVRGRIILALKLHRGVIEILPPWLISALLSVRAIALKAVLRLRWTRATD